MTTGDGMDGILAMAPVIPVVTVNSAEEGLDLARALLRGGLPVIEVTLRTPAALAAIEAIAKNVDGVCVGAGTVLNQGQLAAASSAGAAFAVSPGVTPDLLQAFRQTDPSRSCPGRPRPAR